MKQLKYLIDALKEILEGIGVPEIVSNWISLCMSFILAGSIIGVFFGKVYKAFIKYRNVRLLNRDLSPYYSKTDIDRATQYYIRTRFQNVSPSEDEEPGSRYIGAAKEDLIKLFIKKVFRLAGNESKYYFILADTGMGKTTFMINLYLSYIRQPDIAGNSKLEILLVPFGASDCDKKIQAVKEPQKTILLLDAFDEDVKASEGYQQRLRELIELIKLFKYVVITCRTQFFSSEIEEPYRTGYMSFGDYGKEYLFQKLYISSFDDSDIKKYIRKRYPIWLFNKRKRVMSIVLQVPQLAVRPLLLSYMDDLISNNQHFEFTFEIYQALIDKWLEREASKPGIIKKYGTPEKYKNLLLHFSQKLAIDFWQKRELRNGYYINVNEDIEFTGIGLRDIDNDYKLSDVEIRSKSLLNRNSKAQYKFSHKSILEFILAEQLVADVDFIWRFRFEGMNAALKFLIEMSVVKLRMALGVSRTDDVAGNALEISLELLDLKTYRKTEALKLQHGSFHISCLYGITALKDLFIYDKKFDTLIKLIKFVVFNSLVRNADASEKHRAELFPLAFPGYLIYNIQLSNNLSSRRNIDVNNYRWLLYYLVKFILEPTQAYLTSNRKTIPHEIMSILSDGANTSPKLDNGLPMADFSDYLMATGDKNFVGVINLWLNTVLHTAGENLQLLSAYDAVAKEICLFRDLRKDCSVSLIGQNLTFDNVDVSLSQVADVSNKDVILS